MDEADRRAVAGRGVDLEESERVATHTRVAAGQRSVQESHLPPERRDLRHRSRSYWEHRADRYALQVTLPVNVRARVCLPTGSPAGQTVRVDGKAVTGASEGNYVAVDGIGSGVHNFERDPGGAA